MFGSLARPAQIERPVRATRQIAGASTRRGVVAPAARRRFNGGVFVQVIRGKVADSSTLHAALDRWETEVRPGATGFLGSTAGVSTDGELLLVARFESEDVARRNSDRPEQGAWWSEFEQALAEPAAFAESSEVDVSMGGGSDDAGFVQVFWGRGDRAAARSAMLRAEPILRRERPDILGGFTIWLEDDRFIDVAYFRSEQEAREGEARELSEEGRAVFEEFGRVLAAEGYADIPGRSSGVRRHFRALATL